MARIDIRGPESYIAAHLARQADWARGEAEAAQRDRDHRAKVKAQAEAEEAEKQARLDRHRQQMTERNAEVAPWVELQQELRRRAADTEPMMACLREQDLDGAADALLRMEAYSGLVPRLAGLLERQFPFPLYLRKFDA